MAEGKPLWAGGKLIPAAISMRIEMHLISHPEHDGPAFDPLVLAAEPEVDHWEAGILYPTWEQTVALCELTGTIVNGLCDAPLPIRSTSLWLHMTQGERDSWVPPVMSFTQQALADRLCPS